MLNLAQIIQSHALSFFHLVLARTCCSAWTPTRPSATSSAWSRSHPDWRRTASGCASSASRSSSWLGGKRIHPAWVVPGGVNEPLDAEARDEILAMIPEALAIAERTLDWFKSASEQVPARRSRTFANFPTLFMGLVSADGGLEHYDGKLRVVRRRGQHRWPTTSTRLTTRSTSARPSSRDRYLKSPYYKPLGYPDGIYRVGPLARLNVADRCGTPHGRPGVARVPRAAAQGAVLSSFHYHYARLIEILYGIERIEQLLNEPDILEHARARACRAQPAAKASASPRRRAAR